MDFKIFGNNISIGNKATIVKDKKSFVSGGGYNSLSDLIGDGAMVSVQTFYDLYKKNPDIRQSIRKIGNSVARDGIYLTNNEGEPIDDTALNDEVLGYFKMPTFLKFKVDVYRNYLLSGDLYIIPMVSLRDEVLGFEILDSRSMGKRVDENGNIIGFVQYNSKGKRKAYEIDELAYFQFERDINNANLGMGLLHGIVRDALSDLEASKTNYKFFENDSIPNSILLLDDDLNENEMKLAQEQFKLQYQGTQNKHKMLIGGGIKDIKTLSINHRDMEFINQKKMTTEKISATFGVPKSILGYVDNVNYANAKELRKEYIDGTIKPYELDFENILNVLTSKFLPKIYEKYWINAKGETADDEENIQENQRKDLDKGLKTINEIRIERGMNELPEENADKPLVSRNSVLLEDVALDAVLSPNEI